MSLSETAMKSDRMGLILKGGQKTPGEKTGQKSFEMASCWACWKGSSKLSLPYV